MKNEVFFKMWVLENSFSYLSEKKENLPTNVASSQSLWKEKTIGNQISMSLMALSVSAPFSMASSTSNTFSLHPAMRKTSG